MSFLNLLLFILACLFSFYIPGRVLLHLVKIKLKGIALFIFCWVSGISLFLLVTYILSYMGISQVYIVVLVLFTIYYFIHRKKFNAVTLNRDEWMYSFIILIGAATFTSLMYFSGYANSEGLMFYDWNSTDGILHIALIQNLINNFPPTHPGVAEVPLRGYHYFYDFLISRFIIFYQFSVYDLYFRYFHFLISCIYGAGFLMVAYLFSKERVKNTLILLFAYFGQGFTFILLFFDPKTTSIYGLSQPIELVFNPLLIFAIGMMLCSLYLLPRIKDSVGIVIIFALILGVTSQIKVYAGLIGIVCFCIYALFLLIKTQSLKSIKNYIAAGVITAFITIITYFPNNWGAATITLSPFLFYAHFMQQQYFINWNWEIKRQIFAQDNNTLRVILLYLQSIVLLWFLGLGLRLFALLNMNNIINKSYWKKDENIILSTAVITSITLATFFIQSISSFDIIQFYWITLMLLSIPSGLAIGELIKKSSLLVRNSIIVIIIVHSFIGSGVYIYKYYAKEPLLISHDDINTFTEWKKLIPVDSYAVVLPEGFIEDQGKTAVFYNMKSMPYVAAMTGRSIYYEKEVAQFNISNIYSQRERNLSNLYLAINSCNEVEIRKLLVEIGTSYVITQFDDECLDMPFFKKRGSAQEYHLYTFFM